MDGKPTPNGEPLDETHCVLVFDQPQTLTGWKAGNSDHTETATMLRLGDEWRCREGQRITVNDPDVSFPWDTSIPLGVPVLDSDSSIT